MLYLSHYDLVTLHTWHPTKYQNDHPWLNSNCRKSDSFSKTRFANFHKNTSPSHDNLRRVSKSPLLHPFTCRRSGTLDRCVMKATSADSSRLIHSILAHSSTLHYLSFFCHHRTIGWCCCVYKATHFTWTCMETAGWLCIVLNKTSSSNQGAAILRWLSRWW
jgi:hypothetical protein